MYEKYCILNSGVQLPKAGLLADVDSTGGQLPMTVFVEFKPSI
jgi:hypothetical protein